MRQKIKQHQKLLLQLAGLIVLVLGIAIISWQHHKISVLSQNQYPIKQFTSYDDCALNGGIADANTSDSNGFNVCLGYSTAGYKTAFMQYSSQNLPRIDTVYSSLTELEKDNQGCGTDQSTGKPIPGYFHLAKQVPDRFILFNYGCGNDPYAKQNQYFMIAMKVGSGWAELSPTNNFNPDGVPSCLMVDVFKISKKLTPKCFKNTGYDDGAIRNVQYL